MASDAIQLHRIRTSSELRLEIVTDTVSRTSIAYDFEKWLQLSRCGCPDRGEQVVEELTIALKSTNLALHCQAAAAVIVFIFDAFGVVRYARDTWQSFITLRS